MRASSTVLATFVAALACSSTPMNLDGGGDAGSGDAGSDGDDSDVAGAYDGTADAESDTGTDGSEGDTGVEDARRQTLCDGQQHLRLWVLRESGGQQASGSYVRIENGSPLLTIDGTCSHWVGAGWGADEDAVRRDRPFRTGKLSDADIRAVEDSVPLDDVAALADCVPNSTIPDGSTQVIRTAAGSASCGGITTASNPGTRFRAAWTALQTIANNLWENGTPMPMDGALHVSAFGPAALPPTPTSPPAYVWPMTLPLSSFVLDSSEWSKRGVSRLVEDPDHARQLRVIRDQYLADRTAQPGLFVNWSGLIATDQSTTAVVFMRDAIPYEDAQGLLKF